MSLPDLFIRSHRHAAVAFLHIMASVMLSAQPSGGEVGFSGIVSIGKERFAALEIIVAGERPAIQWVKQGDKIGIYELAEILDDSVVLRRRSAEAEGRDFVIPLKKAIIVPSDDTKSEDLTAERIRWINSKDNPMLHGPVPLPSEAKTRWPDLSEEERSEIQQFYLTYGWRLRANVLDEGFVEFSFDNVFEDHREKVVAENHLRFKETFSMRQRALWDAIFGQASTPGESLILDNLTVSEQATIRHNWAEFEASLTPEQQAMRRRLSDFRADSRDGTEAERSKTPTQEGGSP